MLPSSFSPSLIFFNFNNDQATAAKSFAFSSCFSTQTSMEQTTMKKKKEHQITLPSNIVIIVVSIEFSIDQFRVFFFVFWYDKRHYIRIQTHNWFIQEVSKTIIPSNKQRANLSLSFILSFQTWQSTLKRDRTGLIDCHYWITQIEKNLSWHMGIATHLLEKSKQNWGESKRVSKREKTTFSHRIRHPSEIVWSKAQVFVLLAVWDEMIIVTSLRDQCRRRRRRRNHLNV